LHLFNLGGINVIEPRCCVCRIDFIGSVGCCCPAGGNSGNAAASASSALTNPPVFQGLMVDAKGKTVGRLVLDNIGSSQFVVRQINGIWVALPVTEAGFSIQPQPPLYWYQSADCTVRWSRLSEQIFRVDKWSACRG
jgi:hypothetical protein